MKTKKKKLARKLRSDGWSLRAIASEIQCSKSSISRWTQDISLTDEQIKRLRSNQDKGRAKAANHPNSPKKKWEKIRNDIIETSSREISSNSTELNLKILGTALYWAEGYNAARNLFLFSNSNPQMIKIMMKFVREICRIPKDKIKGRVNIHPHLDIKKAETFWSELTKIPQINFNKPALAVSRASKQKKDSLPLGTFNIIICDVVLASRVKGWIKRIAQWADSSVG